MNEIITRILINKIIPAHESEFTIPLLENEEYKLLEISLIKDALIDVPRHKIPLKSIDEDIYTSICYSRFSFNDNLMLPRFFYQKKYCFYLYPIFSEDIKLEIILESSKRE